MKNDLFKIAIAVSVGFVVIAVGSYFYFQESKDLNREGLADVRNSIEGAIEEDLSGSDLIKENFSLIDINSRYARATFSDAVTGEFYDVFLVDFGSGWQIAELTNSFFSCEKLESYNFPSSFIQDCSIEFPNAKTVSEALDEDSEEEITQIIAEISLTDDPSCPDCFDLTSGGETITVTYDDLDGLNTGDTVIVDVDVSADDEGNTIIVVSDIEVVISNDDEDDDFDITDQQPESNPEQESILNPYDIDNSGVEIEIIGD